MEGIIINIIPLLIRWHQWHKQYLEKTRRRHTSQTPMFFHLQLKGDMLYMIFVSHVLLTSKTSSDCKRIGSNYMRWWHMGLTLLTNKNVNTMYLHIF